MDRALCVIAEAAPVAQRLAAGRGDRRLLLSYGVQVPVAAEFAALTFWAADAYAARLHLAGLAPALAAPALAAPAWDWLSGVDPALLGREVVSTTLDRLTGVRVFVKPAVLKLVGCPAGVWDVADFRRAAALEGADAGMRVQTSRDLLDLDHEHRFVVREGEVVAGSPYRVGGRAFHAGLVSSRSTDALRFAREAVRALGEDCPPVCSLDVALDVRRRRWLVVEANALWASGPYRCDPRAFVDAVEAANRLGAGRWAWAPEATQLARAHRHPAVVAVGLREATGYVEFAG